MPSVKLVGRLGIGDRLGIESVCEVVHKDRLRWLAMWRKCKWTDV